MEQREKSIIFVVNEEELIASSQAAILRLEGLDAVAFTQSSQALLASRYLAPDLLISEILMPMLSGAELAQYIQWSYPKCKVLLFTGDWDREDAETAAFEDGLRYQFIVKPVHPKELIQKVREMLAVDPVLPTSLEERARLRTMENMRETIAAVEADIEVTRARKRAGQRRIAHHGHSPE